MNTGKRAAVVGALAVAILGATPMVAALATTKSEDGGTWTYGAGGSTNYSDYYHPSKEHRSSVSNDYGTYRSANEAGGLWADVSETVAISGNQAFWDVL